MKLGLTQCYRKAKAKLLREMTPPPEVFLHENVHGFEDEVLNICLGDLYDIQAINKDGPTLGPNCLHLKIIDQDVNYSDSKMTSKGDVVFEAVPGMLWEAQLSWYIFAIYNLYRFASPAYICICIYICVCAWAP